MVRIKQFLAQIYWHIFKPKTLGTRILIIDEQKILLVKHSYILGWYIPGGGVKSGESFEEAIKREMFEEIGIHLHKPELFGIYQNTKEGKQDTEVIFISKQKILDNLKPVDKELKNINFFDINDLPPNVSPGSKRRINEYLSNDYPKVGIW